MKTKILTMIVISIFIVGILGYDVYALLIGGTDATVSNVIVELSYEYPAGTFAIGFVMGHLFWQLHKTKEVK
jgi:hypothetical protein